MPTLKTSLWILFTCFIGIAYASASYGQDVKTIAVEAGDIDSRSIDAQVQAQLDALNKAKQGPAVIPRLITEKEGYRLWTTAMELDERFAEGLDEAYQVFTQELGKPLQQDVVLLSSAAEMARIDSSALQASPMMLPLDIAEKKGKSKNSTAVGVVRHEMCHKWLMGLADTKGVSEHNPANGADSTMAAIQAKIPAYGHRGLPDWLDETVAVMCEMGELADSRLVSDYPTIPLNRFLTMEHPVYAQIKQRVMAAYQSNNKLGMLKLKTSGNNHIHFYYQSAWFKRFLDKEVGEKALLNTLNAIADGRSSEDYLLGTARADSMEDFSAQFDAFVDSERKLLAASL